MPRTIPIGLVLVALCGMQAARPGPVRAQGLVAAAIGGGLGLAGGGLASVGIVAWKAQHGDYLYSAQEALGWESTPILIGGGVGLLLGATDQERLRNTVLSGLAGGVLGATVGAALGDDAWQPPEGRWAGGVVGGAAGLVLGSLVGMLLPTDDGGGTADRGVPVSVRIPFP